jgi:hypothetical protein
MMRLHHAAESYALASGQPVFYRSLTIEDTDSLPRLDHIEAWLQGLGMNLIDYDCAETNCPHFEWEGACFVNERRPDWLALAIETVTPPFAELQRLTLLSNSQVILDEVGLNVYNRYFNLLFEFHDAGGSLPLKLPAYFPNQPSAHNLRKWLRFARLSDAEWPGQGCHVWDGIASSALTESMRITFLILREIYGIKLRAAYIPVPPADLGGQPFTIDTQLSLGLSTYLEIKTRAALSHSDEERLIAHTRVAAAQSMLPHFLYLRWDLEASQVAGIIRTAPVAAQLAWAHQGLVDAGMEHAVELVINDWLSGCSGRNTWALKEHPAQRWQFIENYARELFAFSARPRRSQAFIDGLLANHAPELLPMLLKPH